VSTQADTAARVTTRTLREMKARGERIVALTAYDAAFARVLDTAGCDFLLVGDSVGMVAQGRATTIPVTVDEIIYHTQMVARGTSRALLMADMPFMSYHSPAECLHNAARLMKEGGAEVVKLEWGALQIDMVARLTECGIPVCAHLGLTPQAIFKLGSYRVQGREHATATRMKADALALEQAGADLLLLECVPMDLAREITRAAQVPVIGIGAGPDVDGQILVLYDILDIAPGKRTRFSKNYMDTPEARSHGIHGAIAAYVREVRGGQFPTAAYAFR
jgi:3-methyl-2-oxobutanoate hydroxymethyltransferase